jgi:hypothetical protein
VIFAPPETGDLLKCSVLLLSDTTFSINNRSAYVALMPNIPLRAAYTFRNTTPPVVPDPTCNPVVALSVTATFSTSTFGRSIVTAPMSGTDGAYLRTPNPRTTLPDERTINARTRLLARTPALGFEPSHSWLLASSWKKVPGTTCARAPT